MDGVSCVLLARITTTQQFVVACRVMISKKIWYMMGFVYGEYSRMVTREGIYHLIWIKLPDVAFHVLNDVFLFSRYDCGGKKKGGILQFGGDE